MLVVVFYEYITWQYGAGIHEFLRAWFNIHWFIWRVFSVNLLIRTLFAPFRRTSESYGRGFNPEAIAQTFAVNLVTRFVGATVKLVLLVVAVLFQLFVLGIGGALFLFFLIAPVGIPVSVLLALIIMVT